VHRSWTGFWHASVAFQRDGAVYRATTARVNRDPEQYAGTDDAADDAADAATIRKLIARFIEGTPPGRNATRRRRWPGFVRIPSSGERPRVPTPNPIRLPLSDVGNQTTLVPP